MRLAGVVDKLAEVFVHRDDQSLFADCPLQDIKVIHTRVNVTHRTDIIPGSTKAVFDEAANPNVREYCN